MDGRNVKLKRNAPLLFWIQALQNVKITNIIITLFYISRNLTLDQVFYLPIIWSVTCLFSEIPSSYLADRWGRKKTIVLGGVIGILHWLVFIFADSFLMFAIGTVFYAISYSFFTGTDDALLYDTTKELGQESDSLKKIGSYYSAQSIFKIVSPIIGALIARDLHQSQFIFLFAIDTVVSFFALFLAMRLTEANHLVDVTKQEAGVMRDAFKLLKNNWHLAKAMLNRTLVFIAVFLTWIYFQPFFLSRGLTVVIIGIGWGAAHVFMYYGNRMIYGWPRNWADQRKVNLLNLLTAAFLMLNVVGIYFNFNAYLLFLFFILFCLFETVRWPVFSVLFNKESHSYNRATTLSLTNFLKSVLDIPLLFISSILIARNEIYPYMVAFALVAIVIIFMPLKKYHNGVEMNAVS